MPRTYQGNFTITFVPSPDFDFISRLPFRSPVVEMNLDYVADALTLIISDNCIGFKMPERTSDLALSGKIGIITMRARTHLIGGSLIVQSEPGMSTTVTLRIPS